MVDLLEILETSESVRFDMWASPHQIKVWTVGMNLKRENLNIFYNKKGVYL